MAASKHDRDEALIEIGAKAIYEFRAHPRRAAWPDVSPAKKSLLRDHMRTLVAALDRKGLKISRVK